MAFVFQTERWKENKTNQSIGPGSYNLSPSNHAKFGLISPYQKDNQLQVQTKSENNNLLLTVLFNHKQPINNSQITKTFYRPQTAKTNYKSQITQEAKSQQSNEIPFLEITNFENTVDQSFQNNKIKTSFRKKQNIIHSNPYINSTYHLFSDIKLRAQTAKPKQQYDKKLNFLLKEQNSNKQRNSKSNLSNFLQGSLKKQNFFTSTQVTSSNPTKKCQFLIASDNCKFTKHPSVQQTSKNQNKYHCSKQNECEDLQTTGINQSDDQSFQYIDDSTPGPGQYNIRKENTIKQTKVQKFGVTQQRFKFLKVKQKMSNLHLSYSKNKGFSRALQQKVAFGHSMSETAKIQSEDYHFYDENYQTIEKKCLNNLIKDRKNPGTFGTKISRTINKKPSQYSGQDFYLQRKSVKVQLPNYVFISKAQRQKDSLSLTSTVDYQGQNIKTIENNLQKLKVQKQVADTTSTAFSRSSPRFQYKINKQEGLRFDRAEQLKKQRTYKQVKAFTFSKQNLSSSKINSQKPDVWTYNTKNTWIKPSHHVRYKF